MLELIKYFVLQESRTGRYIADFSWGEVETTTDIDDAKVYDSIEGIEEAIHSANGSETFDDYKSNWIIVSMIAIKDK